MPEKEISELLKKYLEGRATPEEQKVVDDWYESLSSAERERVPLADRAQLRNAYWKAIKAEIDAPPATKHRIWPRMLAIAASLSIVLVATFYLFLPAAREDMAGIITASDEITPIHNQSNDVMIVTLADGSRITLFAKSTLSYGDGFNNIDRKVNLAGEAFFEIAENVEKPFYVFTNEVVTRVLGTSFRVTAYPNAEKITVAVTTGRVSVYRQDDKDISNEQRKKVVLTPNQQLVYHRSDQKIMHTIVEKPKPVVRQGAAVKLRFEGAPVTEVFRALEELYQVDIEFDEETLSGCSITTSVTGRDMFERIDVICEVIGATYRVEDTRIYVNGPGCN